MSATDLSITEQIRLHAKESLAIDLIGFCTAEPLLKMKQNLNEFIRQGYQGDMHYLENVDQRTDPQMLLSGAKSVIVIAINYYREKPLTPPDHGRVARFAWGRDYHKVLRNVLKELQKFLEQQWPHHQHKICVDSTPITEKAFAEKAGLGFYGKNTTLINQKVGSFILLGEIITTIPLQADQPRSGTCGSCTRCLDACPTNALLPPQDGVPRMDPRRCISYQTIETKQPILKEFSQAIGNLIAGCDICQEVCPYNLSLAKPLVFEPLKRIQIAGDSIPLEEILAIQTTEQYLARFAGSPLMRPKRLGLVKNAINAAVNAIRSDSQKYRQKFLPILQTISETDELPQLRQIATEAIDRLK